MMNLENHVPSRSTCEALKAAGFPQDTLLHWAREKMYNDSQFRVLYGLGKSWDWVTIAAPTLAEILEQLPPDLDMESVCHTYRFSALRPDASVISAGPLHKNPAEAAALLWLKVAGEIR